MTKPRTVGALVAVGVLLGATACSGSTDVSGGESASPTQTPPSVSPGDLDPSTYQSLSPRDYALLVKDPDSSKGAKIIVYGSVTQFDAASIKGRHDVHALKFDLHLLIFLRVVYDGIAYSGGDTPEVPAELADSWIKSGWATD
jgi:hypothetical protein